MGLDDLLISTGVDQLIRLVKERTSVKKGKPEGIEINAAAKELRLPLRMVEDWAHVLEEEGLISIEYKLTKIFLVWKAPAAEAVVQKAEKLEAKAAEAKGDVQALLSKVEQGGKELDGLQQELSRVSAVPSIDPKEAGRLKTELAETGEKYGLALRASQEKFAKLAKKASALSGKVGGAQPSAELEKELALLGNFESTLQSQTGDVQMFFEAFEARLEEFRKQMEEDRGGRQLSGLKEEIAQAKSLKEELDGALAAVAEEQKALSLQMSELEKKISGMENEDGSLGGARKRLAEMRKIAEDAKKQKMAVEEQLQDSLTLVKKQSARLREIAEKQEEAEKAAGSLKEDYVDISEEISRAAGELSEKQKEVQSRVEKQMRGIDAAASGKARMVSAEEMRRLTSMLQQLKGEQAALAEKVGAISKESEIIKLQAQSEAASGAQKTVMLQKEPQPREALVERVRLSQAEEDEFERKREELRSLISKMWEESKGG